MDLPTYTNIWRIEKRLYKLYDLRLPMPLPIVWIGVFTGVLVPWSLLLLLIGVGFEAPWHVLYLVPPGVVTWLSTRPVIENKRLTELLQSQIRYLGEPRTWCRMAPHTEPAEIVFVGRVWRAMPKPKRKTRLAAKAAAQSERARGAHRAKHAAGPRRAGRLKPREVRPAVAAAAVAASTAPLGEGALPPRRDRPLWDGRATGAGGRATASPGTVPGTAPTRHGSDAPALVTQGDASTERPIAEAHPVRPADAEPVTELKPGAALPAARSAGARIADPQEERPAAEPSSGRTADPASPAPEPGPREAHEDAPDREDAARSPESFPRVPPPIGAEALRRLRRLAASAAPAADASSADPPARADGGPARLDALRSAPLTGGNGQAGGRDLGAAVHDPDEDARASHRRGRPPRSIRPVPRPAGTAAPAAPSPAAQDSATGRGRAPVTPTKSPATVTSDIPAVPEASRAVPEESAPAGETAGPPVPASGRADEDAPVAGRTEDTTSGRKGGSPEAAGSIVIPLRGGEARTAATHGAGAERPGAKEGRVTPLPSSGAEPAPLERRKGDVERPAENAGAVAAGPTAEEREKAAGPASASSVSPPRTAKAARVSIRAVPDGPALPSLPVPPAGRQGGAGTETPPPAPAKPPRRVESIVGRDPSGGWRRLAQVVIGTGGGRTDGSEIDEARARAVFPGSRRIVVLGCTGGAGQTTTALMVGHTLAQVRDDRVVAVDANTGEETLTSRVRADSPETFTSLLGGLDRVNGYLSMRSYTTRAASGLEVVGADTDAGAEQRLADRTLFSDQRLGQVMQVLDRHYKLIVVDPAAALAARVLPYADQLILVVPASEDGPDAVAMTYEWLDGHGCADLRRRAIMVVNGVSRRSMGDVEQAEAVARGRCRAIVRVPWEDDFAPDRTGPIDPTRLRPATRRAYLALAGVVVAGFVTSRAARKSEEEVAQ